MKNTISCSDKKLDRKTIEKNRRLHMKSLYLKLASLVPSDHFKPSKESPSQEERLGQVVTYIGQLRERVEELKRKKRELAMIDDGSNSSITKKSRNSRSHAGNKDELDQMLTASTGHDNVDITELDGSNLEIVMTGFHGLEKRFMLDEIVNIVEEGGAEVMAASYRTVGIKLYHCTIHAQARVSRVGMDTSGINQKLQDLVRG